MSVILLISLLLLDLRVVYSDDPTVPRTWVMNLDNPPGTRWPIMEMATYYNDSIHEAVGLINEIVPGWLEPSVVEFAADFVLPHLGEDYAEEIRSGAATFGIPLGVGVLLNIFYEVEAGCTSIVAQDEKGIILHARNLDFDLTKTLRKLVIKVEFQKGGKTIFYGTTFAGYIGVLTGMKPNGFAISLNERDTGLIIENLLEALLVPGTSVASFLIRDTLENAQTFGEAIQAITSTSFVASSYIIVSGSQSGQGAVITRNRETTGTDIWTLDSSHWYLVQTNDDHWKPPEDDRRGIAIRGMDGVGQKDVSLDKIFEVLSTPDVLNESTTYTTLMSAMTGNYTVFVRSF